MDATPQQPLRYAVGLPNRREYADPRLLRELGVLAERSGWDGFFLWDGQVAEHPGEHLTDSWTTLAAIAADTERLRLGVMVNVLALKRPAEVARATVALDLLSGGRLVFGAGLGSSAAEFQALGEDPDPRVRAEKLDEALQVLDGLWTGRPFTFHGRWFTVKDLTFQPVSPQRPRIPVWIAGTWPSRRPMRRAAHWDGVFPTRAGVGHTQMMPPVDLAAVVAYVRAQQAVRNGSFDVVMEGRTSGLRQDADATVVTPYRAAGLTWWVEKLGWFRGPVDLVRARIGAGPPRPLPVGTA
ncbi:LLM class flavin-dependent oxidoreductase [Streptomyces sp. NRRL WC-3742]|uniref:LLM class flavin-dependent oxidoreductase n=1 Tax=Streptomyces sp. NRRL WC-3742 TaxID=1463934 RepID=UPI00055EC315|nr:LLM class flavin-dependent oxidoreductase [Streptomyces sp. NRRL WC-3742]